MIKFARLNPREIKKFREFLSLRKFVPIKYIFLNKLLDYQGQVRAKVEVAVANLHSVSYVNSSSCICFKSVNNSCLYLYICTQPSVPSPKLVSSPRQIVSNLKRMSLFLRKFFNFEKVAYCQD